MDDRKRFRSLQRLSQALAARSAALETERSREVAQVERLAQEERTLLERRSDTIAGLSLELELSGARLTRLNAEREQALIRESLLREALLRARRIGDVMERRKDMIARKIERAHEEERIQDWVQAIHLRK